MKAGVGYCTLENPSDAGRTAAEDAVRASGPPALAVVFTTDFYDQKAVHSAIKQVVGPARLLGFCCGGVITRAGVLTRGIGVCTLSGPELKVATALQAGLGRDARGVGQRVGRDLSAPGLADGVVLAFPDGFSSNISEALRGLYETMGPDFRYAGGGAGDNVRFFKTYQFTEAAVESDALAAGVLSGIATGTAIGHGWRPMGEPVVIGETHGKTVAEIDGKTAFDAWCERLGAIRPEEFPTQGMKHPLGLPDLSGNYVIRDPLAAGADGGINFVTEVPRNAVGYLMEGRMSDLIAMAGAVARSAAGRVAAPRFALCFDCISRYLLMGPEFAAELSAIGAAVGADVPLLGALTFGEVGSYVDVPLFHNKTLTVVVGGDGAR